MTRCAATVAALALALAAAPPARAQPTVTTAGVAGGHITSFSWDPTHAGTLWAGVYGGGLFKSANGGSAWTQVPLPSIAIHTANKVLASKAAANLVFVCETAVAPSSIWRSGSAGASFAGVLTGDKTGCTALADGATAGTLYAGVGSDLSAHIVYKSVDAGVTWTPIGLDLPDDYVTDLVTLPSGRVVAAVRAGSGGFPTGTSGAIYYSDNGGLAWTLATGSGTNAVAALAFNGSNELMALTGDGTNTVVYTSPDGATWTAGYTVAVGYLFGTLAYHAASDTFFVMADDGKLLQSANAAGSYVFSTADKAMGLRMPIPLSLADHSSFAVDPADATHLLVGDAGGDGVFASVDGGGVWVVSNAGLYSAAIWRAIKTPSGLRYAAGTDGFIFFGGGAIDAAWTRVYRPTDTQHDNVSTIAVDSADDKHVVVAQSDYTSFSVLRALPDATAVGEDVSPFPHSAWQTLTYPDAASTPIASLLVDGNTLFAGVVKSTTAATGQYLYTSTNGGTSWTPTSLTVAGGVRSLAFDPSNHMTIYAGAGDRNDPQSVTTAGGLWKSTDGGGHFTRISTNDATLDGESPRTIVVDPSDGKRLWLFADKPNVSDHSSGDIFETLDGGATWTTITPSGGVLAFTYSPAEGLLAYASATQGMIGSVFVSPPGGAGIWSPGFAVDGYPDAIYAGSIGVATTSGLYEASGVMGMAPDGGVDGGGGSDGMLPIDNADMGGPPAMSGKGCGCGIVPASGAAAWSVALLAIFVRLLFRRRAAPARRRA